MVHIEAIEKDDLLPLCGLVVRTLGGEALVLGALGCTSLASLSHALSSERKRERGCEGGLEGGRGGEGERVRERGREGIWT